MTPVWRLLRAYIKYKPTACSQAGERTPQNDLSNLVAREEEDP